MKIVALETLRPTVQPNLLFVRLHTDSGLVGLGEAFYAARAVEVYLHDVASDVLLGMVQPSPERCARALTSYVGYQGAGVETRARGAVDLALWDLLGQTSGRSLGELLGGPVRDSMPIYNTCAGSGYVSVSTQQASANWGLPTDGAAGPYEDLLAFLTRPGELARELHDEGIPGMKVWPFDQAAERTAGTDISRTELDRGIAIIEKIRAEVGLDMDIMVELHGLWDRRCAKRIIDALEPYRINWVEDPLRPDAVDALTALAAEVDIPIATGETCVGHRGFAPLLQRGAVDVVTVDVQWTGGVTEARKVATLADAYGTPIAPHDCSGPVSLAACTHLVTSQPNGLVQETVRSFLRTWYDELVTGLPLIDGGEIRPAPGPGHGVRLRDDLADRADVERVVTRL